MCAYWKNCHADFTILKQNLISFFATVGDITLNRLRIKFDKNLVFDTWNFICDVRLIQCFQNYTIQYKSWSNVSVL